MVPVNYLAILACGIVAMIVGFLWYGPIFGKSWARMMGINMDQKPPQSAMIKSYGIMFIGSLLMAFVLSHALIFASTYLHESGVSAGLQTGFWNWLGFIAPVTIGAVLWEKKPWTLWFITSGYYLVLLLIMGVILALWH
jgi:hypothetical protein